MDLRDGTQDISIGSSRGDPDLREKVSTKMNDTYLKVNWQSEGVKTYGREVDLMLWDYCPKYE